MKLQVLEPNDFTMKRKILFTTIQLINILLLASLLISCTHKDVIFLSQEIIPPNPDIASISINGIPAIQTDSSTFYVRLPYGTYTKYLTIKINSNPELRIEGIDPTGKIDLSNPLNFKATINGNSREYSIIACYSDIPVVYLNTPAPIENKTDWVKGCSLQITNAGEYDGMFTASIKGRGNSTWQFPKKPYAIKLDNKSVILGMPKHKRWCLLANWMDRTNIRNAVALKIGNLLPGLEWTPTGQFVDLVFNGKFVGNYYLCEQIKIDKNRIAIDELEPSDIDEATISGGYLLEFDTNYDEEYKFRTSILDLPVNMKSPDEDVPEEQLKYIKDYINNVEQKLSIHAEYSEIETLIDIDSYIDWWLLHELTYNWEPNHPKSSYMYKKRDGKLYAGPAWDFDWGAFTGASQWRIKSSLWYRYLFSYPEFIEKTKNRWNAHSPALMSVSDYIDDISILIDESSVYDYEIWPLEGRDINHDEQLTYKESVALLKKNYLERLKWMDENIPKL